MYPYNQNYLSSGRFSASGILNALILVFRIVDDGKVQNSSNSKCHTTSSEHFRFYLIIYQLREPRECSPRSDKLRAGPQMGRRSNLVILNYPLHVVQDKCEAHSASYAMDTLALSPGLSSRNIKLTIHLQLVPSSRKVGSIHSAPLPPSSGLVLNYLSTEST